MAKMTAIDPAASLAKAIVESLVRRRRENAGYPVSLREVARGVAADISEADGLLLRGARSNGPGASTQRNRSTTRCDKGPRALMQNTRDCSPVTSMSIRK